MEETLYDQEATLQDWLSNYPELIPGDQINPEDPRRWLLIRAEMGVPDRDEGSNRWSLDHLFLDQDGIPTFVECKRSVDTRARREVVAQMLDYAANGLKYWSMERIQEVASQNSGTPLEDRVAELIGSTDTEEMEGFWNEVEENPQEGRVRLLFVADETTKELRRLVEFLNEKLLDIEVLIVEVKQFSGESQTAVVPRVIGATEAARETKGGSRSRRSSPWTKEEFLDRIAASDRSENLETARKILEWAERAGFDIEGGRGPKSACLYFVSRIDADRWRPFSLYDSAYRTKLQVISLRLRQLQKILVEISSC